MCVQASNLKVWAGSCEDDSECRQLICGTKWTELLSLPRKVTFIRFSAKLVPQFFTFRVGILIKPVLNRYITEMEATPFFTEPEFLTTRKLTQIPSLFLNVITL
jgi:hypothetical protein